MVFQKMKVQLMNGLRLRCNHHGTLAIWPAPVHILRCVDNLTGLEIGAR